MPELAAVAPTFVDMAHRIVWAVAATTNTKGQPSTRVLHPIWEWNGTDLTGWIATSPESLKARHLDTVPALSLTYWDASQDTCTADCDATWDATPELRREGWDRFANGPAPVGYLPSLIPGWTDPDVASFGVLRLRPYRLRLMPGSLMMAGVGELLNWAR